MLYVNYMFYSILVITTWGATSDYKVGIMTSLGFSFYAEPIALNYNLKVSQEQVNDSSVKMPHRVDSCRIEADATLIASPVSRFRSDSPNPTSKVSVFVRESVVPPQTHNVIYKHIIITSKRRFGVIITLLRCVFAGYAIRHWRRHCLQSMI